MSQNHKDAPFTLNKAEAAKSIFNNINRRGLVYPKIGLLVMSLIIRFLPRKIINRLR